MKSARRPLFMAALLFELSLSSAYAQTIAGTVRDATGSVLPGVTVEASSPALIEKTRAVISDGAGQYQIVKIGRAHV